MIIPNGGVTTMYHVVDGTLTEKVRSDRKTHAYLLDERRPKAIVNNCLIENRLRAVGDDPHSDEPRFSAHGVIHTEFIRLIYCSTCRAT